MREVGPLSYQRVVACADLCEACSAAFDFPTEEFVRALTTGAFRSDVLDCLRELGVCERDRADVRSALTPLDAYRDEGPLASELRKEYSRLFLSPGRLAVIYPYESAFRFVEGGGKGFPTLFANPITNDVEKRMRAADALPEDARKVPVDSIHRELDFLRVLLTNAAACLHAERPEDARQWLELAEAFRADHIETWVPSFMRRTAAEARHPVYRGLAEVTAGYVQFIA